MNNRKQTNERGKNPRSTKIQIIVEPVTIKRTIKAGEKDEQEITLPNPRYPGKKRISHMTALPL